MAAAQSSLARLPLAAKLGLGAGLLLLVAVAYFVVFYGDLASSVTAAEKQERQLRQELADAHKLQSSYQKDLAELSDRERRKDELAKILPAKAEYPSFLSSLQSVANVSGVILAAWTPQEEVTEEFYARVPMKVELTGRYHQVARFFYGVGQLDRIINMENISITDPEREDAEEDVLVHVTALATAFRSLGTEEQKRADKRSRAKGKGKGKGK